MYREGLNMREYSVDIFFLDYFLGFQYTKTIT